MTRCPLLYRKNKEKKKKREKHKLEKGKREVKEEAAIRWIVDKKEDWGREKEMEINYQNIEGMMPSRFHKWLKVFERVESERILVRKI